MDNTTESNAPSDGDKASASNAGESLGLASALISARAELGMTQAELAERSGISRSAIKGYETGRNMPGSRELKALCAVLKLTPNMALFGTEQPFTGSLGWPWGEHQANQPEFDKLALVLLLDLLAPREVQAIRDLVFSLAAARHGGLTVKEYEDDAGRPAVDLLRFSPDGKETVLSSRKV